MCVYNFELGTKADWKTVSLCTNTYTLAPSHLIIPGFVSDNQCICQIEYKEDFQNHFIIKLLQLLVMLTQLWSDRVTKISLLSRKSFSSNAITGHTVGALLCEATLPNNYFSLILNTIVNCVNEVFRWCIQGFDLFNWSDAICCAKLSSDFRCMFWQRSWKYLNWNYHQMTDQGFSFLMMFNL